MNITNVRAELGLALSYLKPKRNAVSVITCISVIGVMLGVAVLIIVLSVMTGFTDTFISKILETTSHLKINQVSWDQKQVIAIHNPTELIEKIKAEFPDLTLVPATESPVLLQFERRFEPKAIVGLDPIPNVKVNELKDKIKYGTFSLEKDEIMIGLPLARQLGVRVGDKILIHSPSKLAQMVEVDDSGKVKIAENAEMSLPKEFKVTAIFEFDKYDFDAQVLFTNLDDANDLLDLRLGSASTIYGWVNDPMNMKNETEFIAKALPKGFTVVDWRQMNEKFLGVVEMEKVMMFFLLGFIVLVAAFSIMNTLITVVVQKTREIGILKALGATSGMVARVFILQGLIVGFIGNLCGIALGITVVIFRNDILSIANQISGRDLFPREFYYFGGLPARIDLNDILLIGITSIILCTLGAVIPAIRAAALDPAKALRYE